MSGDGESDGSDQQPVHRTGGVALWWDADQRIATMRFVEPGSGSEQQATEIVQHLVRLSNDGAEPYGFLVDCSSLLDADAGWRMVFADHFKRHRDAATIAWFSASPRVRLLILMFRTGTGVRGESFETEGQAHDWLTGA